MLPKTDIKFNYAAIKEEKEPVPKKEVPRDNTNTEKYPQKNQICLPKLKDGKSSRELEPNNSSCVTCFVQNPSILLTYVMNTCKLRYIFTNFFTRFVFRIIFFSFLFRHFTIVDEPPFNLNFYDYSTIVDELPFNLNFYNYSNIVDDPPFNLNFCNCSTITRTCSRSDYIDFYEKYFFKCETLRKDLENSHITLHSKEDLNLRSKEGSYTLCTDFDWIQVAVIGLLITKIFFKDSVNFVVYIFYMKLRFSLYTLFFSESEFSYHSSLKLCTTKILF